MHCLRLMGNCGLVLHVADFCQLTLAVLFISGPAGLFLPSLLTLGPLLPEI